MVGGGGRGAGADGAVNAQRMRALEGQVLQAKMESNESKEDAAKVSDKKIRSMYVQRKRQEHQQRYTATIAFESDKIVINTKSESENHTREQQALTAAATTNNNKINI